MSEHETDTETNPLLARIEEGEFQVGRFKTLPPKQPPELRAVLADISDEDVDKYLGVRLKYSQDQKAWETLRADHEKKKAEAFELLRLELETHFEVAGEVAERVYTLASSYAGGDQIALFGFYDDLVGLLRLVGSEPAAADATDIAA